MDPSRLAPEPANVGKKQEAISDAIEMQKCVVRLCERNKTKVPPYEFLELIGKGAYGRVYKCKMEKNADLVAIKIVNTDSIDYTVDSVDKDDTIRDFRKEVAILRQLKDAHAQNVNIIHDAFDLQEQLWIVSDYCTGGSVRTLMRAQPVSRPGLEEHCIIPIARELAIAVKSVHAIGVIHRDIKCTNVYVTEKGRIQLGDFGIVGVTDDTTNKRRTILGTPHYMPREMLRGTGNQASEAYGTEVDIWAYGCTVFEMATGMPPNARTPLKGLDTALARAPRLRGDNHSRALRDFVAFCLNSNPQTRPTADEILEHPYIANTQQTYPNTELVMLVERYKMWEVGGGVRSSLFMAGGAPPVANPPEPAPKKDGQEASQVDDDWNFSTSDSFDADFERRYSHIFSEEEEPEAPDAPPSESHRGAFQRTGLSPFERMQQSHQSRSADRGERSLQRLWAPTMAPYELHTPVGDLPVGDLPVENLPVEDLPVEDLPNRHSELPLRAMTDTAPTRESVIDLDTAHAGNVNVPSLNFEFGDMPTLKARGSRGGKGDEEVDFRFDRSEADHEKRATMEWTFPKPAAAPTGPPSAPEKRSTMQWSFATAETMEPDEPDVSMNLPPAGDGHPPPSFRPVLKHSQTMPVGSAGDHVHDLHPLGTPNDRTSIGSMIDLDQAGLMDDLHMVGLLTARSATGSVMTDKTSGNPFDLEDSGQQQGVDSNRFSYHKQWQSEGGQVNRTSARHSVPMHQRGSSLSSTESALDRPIAGGEEPLHEQDYVHPVAGPSRTRQRHVGGAEDHADAVPWADFDGDYERGHGHRDTGARTAVEHGIRQRRPGRHSVNTGLSGTAADRPPLPFPPMAPPHPNALEENASSEVMDAELDRMLEGFMQTTEVLEAKLRRFGRIEDDSAASESEAGQ